MSELRIHREHALGLTRAREVAWKWAEEAEQRFQMDCTVIEGKASDTVTFKRSGVNGRLVVAADHFDLEAKLGFLLGAFARTIEGEIEQTLDALLAAPAGKSSGKSTARPAAKAPSAAAPAKAAKKTARR